ncbi:hypothetical protein N0V95_006324 [Ascochyta clinopodiicola]|nr:hypothetical protein N0V95_006324 [Ascochyta clinopodiicola]
MAALAALPDGSLLTPEYIAYTNAPRLLTQFGALFGIASLVVALRCYVRAVMIKSFGKDDWIMLLAYAFSAATFATYVEQTKVGMGKHMAVITMNQDTYQEFMRLRQVSSILATFGVALVKISIAYFLLRLVVHRTKFNLVKLTPLDDYAYRELSHPLMPDALRRTLMASYTDYAFSVRYGNAFPWKLRGT